MSPRLQSVGSNTYGLNVFVARVKDWLLHLERRLSGGNQAGLESARSADVVGTREEGRPMSRAAWKPQITTA